ncbi:hypothetical protein I4F81_011812 [Pyropia yezoensis]|uniref:Uncharacterized protein n=1 Tax=Pyropia yezoensis TaxID=2788 RepID=A0ACC3CGV5_PYRYE|nr:hypothetical protein I4F81_011812 [Neopyropia yezoensis]
MATAAFLGLVSLPLRPRGRAGGGCRSGRRPPAAPPSSSPAPAVVIVTAATGGDDKNRALPAAKGFGAPTPGGAGRRGRGGGGADARRADASAAGASVGAAGGGDGTLGFVGADTMGIVFTCGVCDTRISKSISRTSYERGVVLIQCPGCEKRHVIADNLGHFSQLTGGKKNVEEMVGEEVTRVSTDVYKASLRVLTIG